MNRDFKSKTIVYLTSILVRHLLTDNLNRSGLLGGAGSADMSDVWLSMEQAFENDISAMLPNTDDHLSEPGLIVSDLMDSNVTLNDIAHTIKSEPLDLDSNG